MSHKKNLPVDETSCLKMHYICNCSLCGNGLSNERRDHLVSSMKTVLSCNLRELGLSNFTLQDSVVEVLSTGLGSQHCKLEILRSVVFLLVHSFGLWIQSHFFVRGCLIYKINAGIWFSMLISLNYKKNACFNKMKYILCTGWIEIHYMTTSVKY